jgi:hypothetical protein
VVNRFTLAEYRMAWLTQAKEKMKGRVKLPSGRNFGPILAKSIEEDQSVSHSQTPVNGPYTKPVK